jgi:hypothetical protein
MRLIVARCSATYSGRLDTVLPEALRLIMVKADGSVVLQADSGGCTPLNCGLTRGPVEAPQTGERFCGCRRTRVYNRKPGSCSLERLRRRANSSNEQGRMR